MTIDEQSLERKFNGLTNSQESVQTLSLWVLHHKNHYKRIIQVWYRLLEKDKISHRLTMFYLANDVIQHAKKKGYKQYLDGFREVLKKATNLVRDDKIAPKIKRIFNIWNERNIYPDEFIKELQQVLGESSSSNEISSGKESSKATTSSSNMIAISNRIPTDYSLDDLEKKLKEINKQATNLVENLNVIKIDKIDSHILSLLKDKNAGELCLKELSDIENSLRHAVQSLDKRFNQQKSFVEALEKCELFYEVQKEEVKVVANAYSNFTARVKGVKTKLLNNKETLPSPYPSPTIDAPSPNSDDDLILPGHDSPLPGLKSLISVANENAEKNNKISSLDKRLSNLMQNLPINQDQYHKSSSDKKQQQEETWSPYLNTQSNIQQPQQNPQISIQQQQMQQQPMNPSLIHQQHSHSHINQPPTIMAAAINLPPPPIHHPPPFIPHHQIPPPIQNQAYYPAHAYAPASIQNSIFNNNGPITNSPSVQQIQSVISTRNEQQQELIDQTEPYDSYSVGLNEEMDSFCEPADMDLGNSDDEEMNRSSNSQRVLKIIETSDDSSTYSANNSGNNSFNNNNNSISSSSVNVQQKKSTGYDHLPPPPQLPHHVTTIPHSSSTLHSGNLHTTTTSAANLHSSSSTTMVATNLHQHGYQNGQSNSKLYSPTVKSSSFHYQKDYQKDTNQPQFNNNRSPRFNKNYNHYNQSTGPINNNSNQINQPYKQQSNVSSSSSLSSSSKIDYYQKSNNQTASNQQLNNSNNSNRKGSWKNNSNNNKFHNNPHHHHHHHYDHHQNQRSFSNNNIVGGGGGGNQLNQVNSSTSLSNQHHQYQ